MAIAALFAVRYAGANVTTAPASGHQSVLMIDRLCGSLPCLNLWSGRVSVTSVLHLTPISLYQTIY